MEVRFSPWGGDLEARPRPVAHRVDATICGHRVPSLADVLFVDDEPENRAAFADAVTELSTTTCGSAQEAMALIRQLGPAVVVADERMPGMRGTDLCVWLTREHPDIIPIVLTGYGDFKVAQRAAGNARYLLHAPYQAEEVCSMLTDCVLHVRGEQALRSKELTKVTSSIEVYRSKCHDFGSDLRARAHRLLQAASAAGVGEEVGDALRDLDAPIALLTNA